MSATEPMMRRLRAVAGTAGIERLGPDSVRLALRELLFTGDSVPTWHRSAACVQVGPDAFFAESGPEAGWQTDAAKRVCRSCPVRTACLADVMTWERPTRRHGVVGGLSPAERQRLHLRQKATAAAVRSGQLQAGGAR
jgi:WhiB family redox-sensing transcriptional regulator